MIACDAARIAAELLPVMTFIAATGLGCGPSAAEDCFGRECDGGGDTDTDTDSDTDTDADTDSDTDTDTGTTTDTDTSTEAPEHVDCEDEPVACEDIGDTEESQYFGCCFEETVYFCQSGILGVRCYTSHP